MYRRLDRQQRELLDLLRAHEALALAIDPSTSAVARAICHIISAEIVGATREHVAAMLDALVVVVHSLRWSLALGTYAWVAKEAA